MRGHEMTERPTIAEGDVGPDVADLLRMLLGLEGTGGLAYYFDHALTEATKFYQRSRGLAVDGIVGPQTWDALESDAPPYVPPGLPPPLPPEAVTAIGEIATRSE